MVDTLGWVAKMYSEGWAALPTSYKGKRLSGKKQVWSLLVEALARWDSARWGMEALVFGEEGSDRSGNAFPLYSWVFSVISFMHFEKDGCLITLSISLGNATNHFKTISCHLFHSDAFCKRYCWCTLSAHHQIGNKSQYNLFTPQHGKHETKKGAIHFFIAAHVRCPIFYSHWRTYFVYHHCMYLLSQAQQLFYFPTSTPARLTINILITMLLYPSQVFIV